MGTPLTDLITEFRKRWSLMATRRDFSEDQRKGFVLEAVRMVSRATPRSGVRATVQVAANVAEVLLPVDWMTYRRPEDLGDLDAQFLPEVKIVPSFGDPLGWRDWNFGGPRVAFQEPAENITQRSEDGRFVYRLPVAETESRDAAIIYEAFHRVEDETDDADSVSTLDFDTRERVLSCMQWLAVQKRLEWSDLTAGERQSLAMSGQLHYQRAFGGQTVIGVSA